MLLRFTEKLSKKLKTGSLTKVEEEPGPYLNWYAHLFTANRVQYILTTEAKSLLTLVMYGRGISDDGIYIKYLLSEMREYLADTGNRLIFERIIAPKTGKITLSKTKSKSVLGSMNDMVKISKIYLEREEMSPWDLSERVNRIPFKAIGYKRPKEAFNNLELR